MYDPMDESRRAWAFMIRSMLAVHPYSPVTRQHGESTIRFETMTFSTLSSRTSFMSLQSPSVLAFSSSKDFFSSSVSSILSPSLVAQWGYSKDKLGATSWEGPDGNGGFGPAAASAVVEARIDEEVTQLVADAYATCKT